MGAASSPCMAPPDYCHLLLVFVGRQGDVYSVYFPIVPKLDFFFFSENGRVAGPPLGASTQQGFQSKQKILGNDSHLFFS